MWFLIAWHVQAGGVSRVATKRRQGHVEQSAGSERLCTALADVHLGAEVGRLMEEGGSGQRNSITLRKGEGMNVVLLVMKAGDRIRGARRAGPPWPERPRGAHPLMVAEEVAEAGSDTLLTCDAGGGIRWKP